MPRRPNWVQRMALISTTTAAVFFGGDCDLREVEQELGDAALAGAAAFVEGAFEAVLANIFAIPEPG